MSTCHGIDLGQDEKIAHLENKILLMGNPNVGKSVIFSKMTGMHVMSSNFAGTTVSYTKAQVTLEAVEYTLIDVPGTYALSSTSEAEAVATSFMEAGASAVICVLDATNLKRNLKLALEVAQYDIPVVYALNLVDIAERKGIQVSAGVLAQELGAPVITTIAVKGQGLEDLKDAVAKAITAQPACGGGCSCSGCPSGKSTQGVTSKTQQEIWDQAARIVKKCVIYSNENPSFIDKLGKSMVKPFPGIPIALLVILVSLGLIVFGGKGLRAAIFLPLVNNLIVPFFEGIIGSFGLPTLLENILIGEYGIFVIGFEWPIALILPYVAMFYVVFTFLEDWGFLPRMAVLFDGLVSKMGIQGGSLISLMMGYGCAVPAIIGTRVATTRKERIIITTMVCFAVPCISQSGALISLFADYSLWLLIAIFALSFLIIFVIGVVLGKLLQGKVEPIVIEVPNLLIPERKAYFKKLTIRLKEFLIEAEGPMLVAVVLAALFAESGMLELAADFFEPLISGFLGLPKETVMFLILGIVRREMSVMPLLEADLDGLQMFVGGVVALLYLPCISVFGILAKEFNARVAVGIGVGTILAAFLLGGFINQIGQLILY